MKYLLMVFPLLFGVSMCQTGYDRDRSFYRFYAIENNTLYPLVLSLEFHNSATDKPFSVYTEVDFQNRFSEINFDQIAEVKNRTASLNSVMLFNLTDTTSLSWSTVPPHPVFERLFLRYQTRPPWRMSSADSTKWFISRELWSSTWYEDYRRFKLSVTDKLLEIMRKDYSMLERFAEFYERE